ncbi:hypothetical protein ACJMK2_041480 [Sinanodonta woodiana]|uniref:Uncharacterized protein n=1 Tax=Sinanodonta woodiana TaxID=1069815 RepID=A0ABD3W4B5_SINWO
MLNILNADTNGVLLLAVRTTDYIIPVTALDCAEHMVILFDDIQLSNAEMDKTHSYFSLSRNRRCHAIYLAMGFYNVDSVIRSNTSCFIIFNGLDNKHVPNALREHCCDVSRDKIVELHHKAAHANQFSLIQYAYQAYVSMLN